MTIQNNEPDDLPAGTYLSPSWGWKLEFDPKQWEVASESSDEDVDTVLLASLVPYATSMRVLLHTEPRGTDTLRAHLEEAAAAVSNEFPGATIALAEDENGHAILKRLEDHHWIASYVVSYLPDGSGDRIVELDCLAVSGYEAVLTIRMTCLAGEYDLGFPQAGTLRQGLSHNGQPLGTFGDTDAGGSRPKVQY